nr:hypothetical protein [Mycobacterium sp.]
MFAIVLGAIVVSNNSGDAPGASDGPRASGGLSLSPDSSDELAACATPPDMQATSVTDGTGGLTVVTRLRPSCTDGDLLGNNEFRLTVVDAAGRDVAAGLFDLSGNPVPLVGEGTSVTFTFPPGTYWRTADAITGDVQMVAFNDGQESADAGSVSGSAFTAFGPTMPASGDLDAAAHSALVDIAIADLASIDASLLNIWQPQLSSKRPGLFADGVSWNYAEIVREHLELRQRFPSARLVWSGDWPVYSEPNWWITVSGIPFGSGPAALDWCASQGFDGDHCFAKLLSHTMGTSGTTVLRR